MMNMRTIIGLLESYNVPRKFWFNPTTQALIACGDHVSAVMEDWEEMGIPEHEIKEWKEHLDQFRVDKDDPDYDPEDDEYEDALDENQSGLLNLAAEHGWIRGGVDGVLFLNLGSVKELRSAAAFFRDNYGEHRMVIDGFYDGILEPHEVDRFIKSGRLPRS